MPTAAAATYVRTVLFRRRQSSSCERVKGFVLFGRRGGCTAGLGRLHVPSRLRPLSAPPVPLPRGLRHGSTLSAGLAGDPRCRQRQPHKATRLHPEHQSPSIAPGKNARLSGARGQISRGLLCLAISGLSPPLPWLPSSSGGGICSRATEAGWPGRGALITFLLPGRWNFPAGSGVVSSLASLLPLIRVPPLLPLLVTTGAVKVEAGF